MRTSLIPIAALCLLAGCGELEPGTGVFAAQDAWTFDGGAAGAADAGAATDAGTADAGAQLADPVGTWALFVEDRKCLSAVGTSVENVIWTWYRLEVFEATGAGDRGYTALRQKATLCSQALSPLIGGLRTIVPEALVQRLTPQDWSALLLGRATGSGYVSEELVDLWGVRDLGLDEPVPTELGDPRLVDLDEDGEPGVTFVVGSDAGEACRVHVAQRTRLNLDGVVLDSAHIAGDLRSVIDKVVLGATSPLCNSSNVFVPSPTPSRFWMVRIDGHAGGLDLDFDLDGAVTCDEILEGDAILSGPTGVMRVDPDNAVCRAE